MSNNETHEYDVLDSIRHSGDEYEAGDTIELTAKQASGLLALGKIETPAEDLTTELTDEEKQERLYKAVKAAFETNPKKKPNVTDLEGDIGFDITATVRDGVWDQIKAEASQE